jgi:hypothetical protein
MLEFMLLLPRCPCGRLGGEGIVSKRLGSSYRSGPGQRVDQV